MNEVDSFDEKLFTKFPSGHIYHRNGMYRTHLLDQYKIYIEMTDRVSARRQSTNSYFLSINTILLSFVGYVTIKESGNQLWLLGIAGISLNYLWYQIIVSYQQLNSAKFKVIHKLEKCLPVSPYDAEWDIMGKGKNPSTYLPFTRIEKIVPWVFFVLHAIVILHAIPFDCICSFIAYIESFPKTAKHLLACCF